jgi:hypothetical protein
MLGTIALSLALLNPAAPAQESASAPAKLVSKMLRYYFEAQSLTGTIMYTATDGTGQVQVQTVLQFEKPSRIYLRQNKGGKTPQQWLLVSDGKHFAYDPPAQLQNDLTGSAPRLVEPVWQVVDKGPTGQIMGNYSVRQIYAVEAPGLADRSIPLDVAIGRPEDLQHDNLQWMTVTADGQDSINGAPVTKITGKWREYGNQVTDVNYAPGQYWMYIANDGKLIRYVVERSIPRDPQHPSFTDTYKLRETWDVDLALNGKPDPNLFKDVR